MRLLLCVQESIALTQNFVSSVNLPHVLKFVATKSEDLISGCPPEDRTTLHRRFVAALEEHRPEVDLPSLMHFAFWRDGKESAQARPTAWTGAQECESCSFCRCSQVHWTAGGNGKQRSCRPCFRQACSEPHQERSDLASADLADRLANK